MVIALQAHRIITNQPIITAATASGDILTAKPMKQYGGMISYLMKNLVVSVLVYLAKSRCSREQILTAPAMVA